MSRSNFLAVLQILDEQAVAAEFEGACHDEAVPPRQRVPIVEVLDRHHGGMVDDGRGGEGGGRIGSRNGRHGTGTVTVRGRARRAVDAARRELRSPPPVTWELADPRAPNERFVDRVVLVTGAAGLIGSVLVKGFLSAGALVHAVDIDGDGLDRLCGDVGVEAGDRLVTHIVDLGDLEATVDLAERIERLDVLVNNVGYNDGIRGPDELTAESWRHVLDVNLVGPALLTGQLVPRLSANGDGAVLFIASINGILPSPWLHYAAAKAALAKVVVDLAHQLAPLGVRVNSVAPGWVRPSDLPADQRARAGALGAGAVPVEAIVNGVLFLCDTRQCPMTTGQQLVIDGAAGV